MTLDVKFEEQDQTFSTNFGEIQTVSDGGFERGYNEGYAQGEVEGYGKGKTDGLVDGYDKGKTDGLVEGYDKGKTDGLVEGEQVGFDNAISKLTTLEVTENGEYTPSDDNIGFDKVTVNIGSKIEGTPIPTEEGSLIDILFFNYELSPQEVNSMMDELEYKYNSSTGQYEYLAFEIVGSWTTVSFIKKEDKTTGYNKYIIRADNISTTVPTSSDGGTYSNDFILSSYLEGSDTDIGWNKARPQYPCFFVAKHFTYNNSSIKNDGINYVQNEKIKNIVSITPFLDKANQYTTKTLITVSANDLRGVTCIGNRAFSDCNILKKVVLPESVVFIDKYAFYEAGYNPSGVDVFIPNSVTTIHWSAFSRIKATEVNIPDSVTRLYDSVLEYSKIKKFRVPKSINVIPSRTCYECGSLVEIEFHNNITEIKENAFGYCKALKEVVLPDSITTVGRDAFSSCYALEKINIPLGLTKIPNSFLSNARSLTSLTIPANITSIGSYALSLGDTGKKATITFLGTTPPTMTSDGFGGGYYREKIIVPKGSLDAYKSATNWSKYADKMEEATE